MPVLYNKESGLAEEVSDAQAALQSGTHELPLVSPQGELGSVSADQASELMAQGYTRPAPEHIKQALETAKYSAPGQQAITALEGAGSSATLGASTAAEVALGVKGSDITKRRETNPGMHTLGEVAGLTGSMLVGTGEGALLTKAGIKAEQIAEAVMGAKTAGKIGSIAVKGAAENAMFQMGDEASRKFANDPHQSTETALANIGLSAALGGAFGTGIGTTSELWKMGPGKNVEALLSAMKNRTAGLPAELKTAANVELAPEIEGALGNSPHAKQAAMDLMDSGSKRGEAFRASMADFKTNVNKSLPEALGRSEQEVLDLAHDSKYETGKQFQEALSKNLDEKIAPIAEKYDSFAEKFKNAIVTDADKNLISEQVSRAIDEHGLAKGANDSAMNMATKLLEDLPKQETAQDLRKYSQGIMQQAPYGSENYQIGKALKNILNDAQENIISSSVGTESPELFDAFKATQKEYGQFKGLLQDLNDRLHLGREGKAGAASFIKSLKEMEPEKVVQRLGLKNDVGLQQLLEQQFPEVAEVAKRQELNALLKKSMHKDGDMIDATKLFKNLDATTPELKKYLISEESQSRLAAIQDLLNRAPIGQNTSRTATTLDKMWSKMPASGAAVISMLLGHNPITGAILGEMGHWLGREAPDAVKLAMLKFMGSAEATNASGFKAAAEMASATIKGQNTIAKAAKAVFGGTLPPISEPKASDREKLKKQIAHLVENQDQAMGVGGHVGHYLPDHGVALAMTSSRAVQYLEQLRPDTTPINPLDKPSKPNSSQEAIYNRALDIAQSPLLIMKDIKNGTLTPADMKHLQAMYPNLAANIREQLQQQMIEAVHTEAAIPYKNKLMLSMFLGQAMDSSITQQSISAAQVQQMAAEPVAKNGKATPARADKLKDLSKSYLTGSQGRSLARATRQH